MEGEEEVTKGKLESGAFTTRSTKQMALNQFAIKPKKAKPKTRILRDGAKKRRRLAQDFGERASKIDRQIYSEIRSYKPMGRMSEMAEVMGLEPKRGEAIVTPLGTYVFAKARVPSKDVVKRWETSSQEAKNLRTKEADYASVNLQGKPNTWTGNFRVVEHGRKLRAEGLLSKEEERKLKRLEAFWKQHPEMDKTRGGGFWRENLKIEPEKPKPKAKPQPKAKTRKQTPLEKQRTDIAWLRKYSIEELEDRETQFVQMTSRYAYNKVVKEKQEKSEAKHRAVYRCRRCKRHYRASVWGITQSSLCPGCGRRTLELLRL